MFSRIVSVACFYLSRVPLPNSINLPCSLSFSHPRYLARLFAYGSLARSCNCDQNDAQRQEIGNANVARSWRHEPGNWCFSNPRATAVLTLPARIRNAVDPSRRLAGSEILSRYSSSSPTSTASHNDFVIGTANLIRNVGTLHRGRKIPPFFFVDQSSFLVRPNHTFLHFCSFLLPTSFISKMFSYMTVMRSVFHYLDKII